MNNLVGKDRSVTKTIELVKNILNKSGFRLEEKNLLNPVPGIWSVHLEDKDSQFYTNGKGATKENSLASAYCEFLERLATGFFFYDYALDGMFKEKDWVYAEDEKLTLKTKKFKEEILNKELWQFYDPDKKLDFETFTDSGRCINDSIISLPFKNDLNDIVYFPIEILKTIYASNGLSAGNSERETLIQGFSECIERGVKNYIISEGISLPTISTDYLKNNGFAEIIKNIESYNYKVIVKDASLNGRFPVISVLLINQNSGKVLSSFGSHPNVNIAIERTLTELLQGRKIDNLNDFSNLSFNYDEVSDYANIEAHFINSTGVLHYNLVKESNENYTLWESITDLDDELTYLRNLLKKEGYNYYYRTIKIDEMWVSQTIIPKLSEIYPPEDLELEFKNRAGFIRDFFKKDLDNDYIRKNINWFDESYIDENSYVMEYLGVSATDDYWSTLLLFEIELLMLFKLSKVDESLIILNNQIDLELISESRIGFWKCVQCLLSGFDTEEITILFNDEIIKNATLLISGTIPRNIFPLLGDDFSYIKRHNNVNNVYLKYKKLFN